MKNARHIMALAAVLLLSGLSTIVSAQSEVMAWGNITGIRVQGELMEFETSLRVFDAGSEYIQATGKERQPMPRYAREGDRQTVTTAIGQVGFTQIVDDTAEGMCEVDITVVSSENVLTGGVFFCIELPEERYGEGEVSIGGSSVPIRDLQVLDPFSQYPRYLGRVISVEGRGRTLRMELAEDATAFVSREPSGTATIWVYLASPGTMPKDRLHTQSLTIEVVGDIDNEQVEVAIDRTRPGRRFDGLGGNFRLQNPATDPKVIDYCLENLRVAWGRVEMPWRNWHPEEGSDPLALARGGGVDPRVVAAMAMGQRLKAIGMPVIVSAWFPPAWAIEGDPASYTSRGVRAYRLDPFKTEQIYRSLSDYLVWMKEAFGVEADYYSFNESDIGIDVLHTAAEHAVFIKEFGAHLASRGLSTKLLLGDNSDATTFDFILPAMNDPECRPYIGAVSFHSWRGCDDETLRRWGGAAKELNVPLLVGEGSTDAAAWRYPQIFAEQTFALYEINLYIRICALAEPLSILQWQLTGDYSLLLGDGIYGTDGPLRPTQRFWNLRQLASTPEGSFALPFECSKEQVNCAAFGNIARGEWAVHLVNNGAAREAVVRGLPAGAGSVKVYITNAGSEMREARNVKQGEDGTVVFTLPAVSLATVIVTDRAE